MAFIKKVGQPRGSALDSFKTGDADSTSKLVFYVVITSLDAMSSILALSYRALLVVSIELVKVLPLDTFVEAVDKLEKFMDTFTQEMKELSIDVSGSMKASNSV